MTEIQEKLFAARDIKYADFQARLMPNIAKERIIGVRTAEIKALAKELKGSAAADQFISALPHYYFDENQLHAFIIADSKDFGKVLNSVEEFLPFIDNWATCDQLSPGIFVKESDKLLPEIRKWLASDHTYTLRFAVVCLMRYFLDGKFKPEYADEVAKIKSDEYYVKMAVAWYFATALAKQYDAVIHFFTKRALDRETHNKALQKANESFRITDAQKQFLKSLKY